MKFRKHSKPFLERNIMCTVLIVVDFVVMPSNFGVGITLAAALVMGLALVLGVIADNEYITMDKKGVTCTKGKAALWGFAWEDIAELKRSRRNRRPCVEIVLKDGVLQPLSGISVHALYFELGSAAKKAMDVYEL